MLLKWNQIKIHDWEDPDPISLNKTKNSSSLTSRIFYLYAVGGNQAPPVEILHQGKRSHRWNLNQKQTLREKLIARVFRTFNCKYSTNWANVTMHDHESFVSRLGENCNSTNVRSYPQCRVVDVNKERRHGRSFIAGSLKILMFFSSNCLFTIFFIVTISIYSPESQENVEGVTLRATFKRLTRLLLVMPRYCCPVESFFLLFFSHGDITKI